MDEILGNLPDWLGIVLALAGLFGGSSAGVYHGGLARARLELRLEIMRNWTGFVRGGRRYPVLSASEVKEELERSQAIRPEQEEQLVALLSRYRAMEAVASKVRLLPLIDRALWHDWVAATVRKNRSSWQGLMELVHPNLETGGPALVDPDVDLAVPGPFEPAEKFYRHILRHTNPTWGSRWENSKSRARVLLKCLGPSYRQRVRPDSIRMEDVIRQETESQTHAT